MFKGENIKNGNSLCFDPEFVESLCLMQKIRIIKTVRSELKFKKYSIILSHLFRLRVYQAEKLITNPKLKLKLILLVRDPRGVR